MKGSIFHGYVWAWACIAKYVGNTLHEPNTCDTLGPTVGWRGFPRNHAGFLPRDGIQRDGIIGEGVVGLGPILGAMGGEEEDVERVPVATQRPGDEPIVPNSRGPHGRGWHTLGMDGNGRILLPSLLEGPNLSTPFR